MFAAPYTLCWQAATYLGILDRGTACSPSEQFTFGKLGCYKQTPGYILEELFGEEFKLDDFTTALYTGMIVVIYILYATMAVVVQYQRTAPL